MNRKIVAVAAALAVAVGLVGVAGFGYAGHFGPRDPAQVAAMVTDHVEDTLDDLNATPEQRTQILAIKDRLLADAQRLHGSHASTHGELLAQWKSDSPDAAALHALVDRRAAEMKALADEAVDAAIQVHGILTPEQRAQLTKKAERMEKRMQRFRH